MKQDDNRIIEMNLEGEFTAPPSRPPVSARIMAWAVIITAVSLALLVAALALWLAAIILPVVLVAGGVAYLAWRYQMWRGR